MRTTRCALVAGLVLALSSCISAGGTSDAAGTTQAPAAVEPPAPTSTMPEAPTGSASTAGSTSTGSSVRVQIATTSLGDVLVDGKGLTLYLYDSDMQGASTCYGRCATAWPPLLIQGQPSIGAGVDDSKIGTTPRTGGAVQITYGGWPVYFFVKDTGPGQVAGQGVGGVWWVLDADGQPIKTS